MGLDLEGKVVIVTGGARGIGREYVLGFAKEGARVVVCDILDCQQVVREAESLGAEVLALKVDVTSDKDTQDMAKKTADRFGRIDVIVNNAGFFGGLKTKFFSESEVDEWMMVLKSHAVGTFLCCKAVFPYMKEQGGGKIVNVTSGIIWNAFPGQDHYAAAKGAVLAFTRTLARGLGQYNINVNSVAPGLIWTEASQQATGEAAAKEFVKTLALGRLLQPDSPVGAVLFFASPLANDITGQTLLVDGGGCFH